MAEDERNEEVMRESARRAYARENGVCLRCGAKFPPNGRTLCPRCRKALDEAHAAVVKKK